MANPKSWKWAATVSVLPALLLLPSSKTTTKKGVVWTKAMAPFEVVIVPMNYKNQKPYAKPLTKSMPNFWLPVRMYCWMTATNVRAYC